MIFYGFKIHPHLIVNKFHKIMIGYAIIVMVNHVNTRVLLVGISITLNKVVISIASLHFHDEF